MKSVGSVGVYLEFFALLEGLFKIGVRVFVVALGKIDVADVIERESLVLFVSEGWLWS